MAFAFLSVMKGEPLVSKLAVLAQYVVYPSVMLAYCAYVPEEPLRTTMTTITTLDKKKIDAQ